MSERFRSRIACKEVFLLNVLLNEGLCFGGPLNGVTAQSRFSKGFLLVDKPEGNLWIYEWDKEKGVFNVRQEDPLPVLVEGPKNRFRAAEEPNYDVIAAPWVGEAP